MRIEIAKANHIRIIAATMRPRDIEEVRAGWSKEPAEAMNEALEASYFARTMFYDLEPLCIYGLAPLLVLSGSARFWIFASAAIDRHPLAFARACVKARDEVFANCTLATNLIDYEDRSAMRWMQWLGGRALLPFSSRGGRIFSQFIITGNQGRQCRRA